MILVSGASGFIGRALVRRLLADGRDVVAAVRQPSDALPARVRQVMIVDVDGSTDWSQALDGVDAIVHLAARAHVLRDSAADPLSEFRRVNTAGTLNLARQAAVVGVRRLVFISSIGVNGNETLDQPFTADDAPAPVEPYAQSKLEAEQGLREIAAGSELEIVIVRPPLVYGPGAPGNFGRLIDAVARGLPLPLGAVRNQRSLVALDNLVDLIRLCIDDPRAASQTLLVSDGEDLSTTELLQRVGQALGRPARLLPVPQQLLVTVLGLLGKQALAQRLFGSLQVDIAKTRELLAWSPPLTVDAALADTAQAYRKRDVAGDGQAGP